MIVSSEASWLARLAGSAGMGAEQVAALSERFLESMREAAFHDGTLTVVELRQLCRASAALCAPDYFDDLIPSSRSGINRGRHATAGFAAVAPGTPPPVALLKQRRCGHCRTPGHYRSRCPELLSTPS